MKIVIAGGHLTPAYALLEYLKTHTSDEVLYIGRNFASRRFGVRSREQLEIEQLEFQYATLPDIKFDRHHKLASMVKLPLLTHSIASAVKLLNDFQADRVIGFGSYITVPVAIAAALKKVPLILHEQTVAAGLANQIAAPFARRIIVSHESSLPFFNSSKTIVLGNLIRPVFFNPEIKKPSWLQESKLPLLYITGGSQGSIRLNEAVSTVLEDLTKRFCIVHQVGNSAVDKPIERLGNIRQMLPENQRRNYYIQEWVEGNEAAWLMRNAWGMVSRAGANTVSEIVATGVPALFIPLPNTNQNEQYRNAKVLVENGSALILEQDTLNGNSLLETIAMMANKHSEMVKHAKKLQRSVRDVVPEFYGLVRNVV